MADTLLDTSSTSGVLVVNGTVTGSIDPLPVKAGSNNTNADHDWFQVALIGGINYTFGAAVISGVTTDYLGSAAIDLHIKTSPFPLISGTLNDSVAPTFTYTPATSGTYFLAISAGGSDTASQTFKYSISVIQGNTAPSSGVVDPLVPYTDSIPGSPTPSDVVAAALQYVGKLWAWENCTGLVWAIAAEIGAPYYESVQTLTGGSTIPAIIPDPLSGFAEPQGPGTSGAWTTIQTGDWQNHVHLGDIVRIPGGVLSSDDAGHYFVVVGGDAQQGWQVIDNIDPNHQTGQINSDAPVTIQEHTFNNPGNTLFSQIRSASTAYVSSLPNNAPLPDLVIDSLNVGHPPVSEAR